ncbi:hypothetical protein [Citrobacter freundii]
MNCKHPYHLHGHRFSAY